VQAIGDLEIAAGRPQPECGRAARGATGVAFGRGEIAAGARVGALRAVRGGGGLLDFFPGAEAFVGQARFGEPADGRVVAPQPVRLVQYRAVPVDAEGGEITELAFFCARPYPVQVVDAEYEAAAGAAGEQPRQQGSAQIAEMQIPRGARGVPAGAGGGCTGRG